MALGCFWRDSRFCVFFVLLWWGLASANVVLIGLNVTQSFDDMEANFAPSVKGSGECGTLYLAKPLDACSPLVNRVVSGEGAKSPFVLIIRGGCPFDEKVRNAQSAGYKAAIVFDNEDSGVLVTMAGNPSGINIHAVFVSKTAGEMLQKYAGLDMELWILPTFENSALSMMAISFISLLAMSAVLATCFFVRSHHLRRERSHPRYVREFNGMSSQLVKAMPSMIFTSALEDNCTSRTCAICLEDYIVGEKLRVLPCCHKFHAGCVDSWLTIWRTFCPVCKHDASISTSSPPASECTPLLSPVSTPSSALPSARSSLASTSAIQIASSCHSFSPHSSLASSSAIRIVPSSFHSQSTSHSLSLSRSPYLVQALNASRSSVDLRNAASFHRSLASRLISSHSLGFPPFSSPLDSRYTSPFVVSSTNGSPNFTGSSSWQPLWQCCSDSASSFSPLASAQSLPGC